jgi:hypothetical protein
MPRITPINNNNNNNNNTQTHSVHVRTFLYRSVPLTLSFSIHSTITDLPFHLSFLIPSRYPADGCPNPTNVFSHRF